ncbi:MULTISPECIES: sulfate adenylyltransferase [Sulfurospirillum]|jgi:sulfate adenylyltransferase|nr:MULTISPECIES: sulfate adenylyltransferase [Sulfurospirillum]KHG33739.1 MAG: sulfate adenylyltransferase [Sulfurospirillum sp. MES]MCP3653093.1 sulfate adenylyltransferase [Sulfurospirillum sp. DNRA8]MCR1811944.1 sulfate adenylyltransferase [Sulfurospirillum sp. DNRA8]MDY0264887.1 sulfate adenylyltransferase [Sulfurospirillum cavolei]
MESTRKNNRQLFLDKEFIATLALAKEGILHPVDKLMNKAEYEEVAQSGYYKGKPFPFPFIIAPAGEKNREILTTAYKGEPLDFIVDGKIKGTIIVDEVFEVDKKRRIEQIFGTYDVSNPETLTFLKRLGDVAVCGEYELVFDDIKNVKAKIADAKEQLGAKNVSAIMINANPFHRAHERVMRITLEKCDMLVIFLLKPYKQDILSYDLRFKALQYFVDNYLPKNRVVIVPFENTYLFSSYKNAVLDAICASNFGCNKLILGQNHSGIGAYYDKNEMRSILNHYKDLEIDVEIITEFVYCNECKTLVSTNTCPHGAHHHIKYHAESLLEILKAGMLPPAIFMRKDISALILSELFKKRFENIGKIYDAIFPNSGLLENHDEREFYLELMRLHQTTSLT